MHLELSLVLLALFALTAFALDRLFFAFGTLHVFAAITGIVPPRLSPALLVLSRLLLVVGHWVSSIAARPCRNNGGRRQPLRQNRSNVSDLSRYRGTPPRLFRRRALLRAFRI
jgi:hypothetical protein